ncbi:MAG: ZIP family metal transporter [Oscillospiraceae bacterium]|nr:ZIP family metal transporter [Oscillospiraceae bacterium]
MRIVLFSAFAGICGMGLGSVVSAAFKHRSARLMNWTLSFAAGVMIGIVCFGLMPEAMLLTNTPIAVAGLVLGIAVILILNRIVDFVTHTGKKLHETAGGLYHADPIIHNKKALLRSGLTMMIAISLHNIPEGMAIGAGGSYDISLGAMLAVMITLHNIPEGMAIAAPLLGGGLSRGKTVLLTTLSGSTTLIGGVIGVLFGSLSDTAVSLSLAVAGGAMLYIVFGEIIPQTIAETKSRASTIVTLAGVIAGLLMTLV